jgi:ABC-2 type transport system ATP-binding protein
VTGEPAIEAIGLIKSYGTVRALAGVDLWAMPGTVLALLGPNDAGKTTTLRILATLTRPDGGEVRVAGYDVVSQRHEVRRRISLTGQSVAIDEVQTGLENLTTLARLRGLSRRAAGERAQQLLAGFDLTDAGRRRVAGYSGGMRRRLDLAAGLIGRPEVLFLDEPTTGLDPVGRKAMWAVISQLAAAGATVLLTTQYLEEADQLADRVAVIDHGRIVADGTADELKQQVGPRRLEMRCADASSFDAVRGRIRRHVVSEDRVALTLAVGIDGGATQVRGLLDEFDPDRCLISAFAERSATLEDVFIALTGDSAVTPPMETAHV